MANEEEGEKKKKRKKPVKIEPDSELIEKACFENERKGD